MTATRAAVARTAPALPRPARPAPERDRRPHLRIVPPARPRRGAALAVAALLVVCGALLGTAVLHTMLVSGQRQVDQLEEEIRATEQANQARRLSVAELESPARVVEEAERDGMVDPDEVTWLNRGPDGRVEAGATSRPEAADPADGGGTTGTDTDTDDGTDTRATGTGDAADGAAEDG